MKINMNLPKPKHITTVSRPPVMATPEQMQSLKDRNNYNSGWNACLRKMKGGSVFDTLAVEFIRGGYPNPDMMKFRLDSVAEELKSNDQNK